MEQEETIIAKDENQNGTAETTAFEDETTMPASLEEQLAAARADAATYRDSWLRVRAEFANARKRMDRQQLDAYNNALVDVIKKLLPVLDDFDRAMVSVPASIAEDSWYAGIELVQRKLYGILEGMNIEPIKAIGQVFDPNLHEAVMQVNSTTYESGIVAQELQTGYKHGDRVIRPAMVAVAN
ncbi:MAG: nucleotide exchange factor GrpE [Anaerolineales bacterium]|nr:nucleotide exchange factor GrpE [Anaerolineales bacterium]MCB8951993.1 nucleotide exchange factor GrpE [Ardenticatenales bacterium]